VLIWIHAILSAGGAALITFYNIDALSVRSDFCFAAGLFVCSFALLFICLCALRYILSVLLALMVPKKGFSSSALTHFYTVWVKQTCEMLFSNLLIRLEKKGFDKMPAGRMLFVCNHASAFDVLATLALLQKQSVIFLTKPENMKNFVVSGMVRGGDLAITIDRENALNAARTLKNAAKIMQSGEASVFVYPEGTRTRTRELGQFHNGVFTAAQKADVPIAVMTIKGSARILKRSPFGRFRRIVLTLEEIIPSEEVAAMRSNLLGDKVHEIMEKSLNEQI